MRNLSQRRPMPAVVIASLALFVSLSGVGVAATRLPAVAGHAHAVTAHKPLTKGEVNKLIAAYVKAHRSSLRGAPGKQGEKGSRGPQGPGAISVFETRSATTIDPQALATIGPWTLTVTCIVGIGEVSVTGPGTVTPAETSTSISGGAATTNVAGAEPIDSTTGYYTTANSNDSVTQTLFLHSGSSAAEFTYNLSPTNNGTEQCPVVGEIIPLS
jgi:hypothetical protein